MSDAKETQQIIPIVTSFDLDFVPIFSVFLASLIENLSTDQLYEVVILTEGVTEYELGTFCEQLKKSRNITLRPIEMSHFDVPYLDRTGFRRPAFFRLALPELPVPYDKVIYLDPDMVVLDDLTSLFETDIHDVYAGVVLDEVQRAYANSSVEEDYLHGYRTVREYWKRHLGLNMESQNSYFNSGLLLLNLAKIRSDLSIHKIRELLHAKPYVFPDQDILNIAFAGNVKLLDQRWNLLSVLNPKLPYSSEALQARERAMGSPAIIHYAWKKPWKEKTQPFLEYFWFYARKSFFYEQLLESSPFLTSIQDKDDGRQSKRHCFRKMAGKIATRLLPRFTDALRRKLRKTI